MSSSAFLTPKSGALELLKRKPALHFGGRTRRHWQSWRRRFGATLVRLIGPLPPAVPLRVRTVERVRCDGYTRQKILFNPDAFSTVAAYLLVPDGIRRGHHRPGVLCAHGHGNGKIDMIEPTSDIYQQMAVRLCRDERFVVIAPDWRSFGERRDREAYINHWRGEHGGDGCDLSFMLYGYFGYHLLTLNVCDGRRCLDVLAARGDVDARCLGAIGCSFGATVSMYLAALDSRVKAAVISGYLSTIADALGERGRGNTCGSQFLLGLRAVGDISDVAGLIAPRSCLVQIGRRDTCFIESDALAAYPHLHRIYRAAGAAGNLELDHFDGGHHFNTEPALDFLRRRLSSA